MGVRDLEITVNGLAEEVPEGSTISALIERFGEEDVHLIVEHNARCVFPEKWAATEVREGDVVEFVHPNFGG